VSKVALESPVLELGSRTHPGCVRELNEDACAAFSWTTGATLLIADGVSGERGGDTASSMAVAIVERELAAADPGLVPSKALHRAVQRANIAIHDLALAVPELRGMATTLTAVVLARGELFAAHVGDCRLYLFREGQLLQLTRDHTVAAERARLGLLNRRKLREHPGRSTLTRSLGRDLIARVDQLRRTTAPRDLVLVCSDGIHGVLDDAEIARCCSAATTSEICDSLVDTAYQRGAPDNMTAAAARIAPIQLSTREGGGLVPTLKRVWRR
jgi:PPM family protein phosphatase